MDQPDVRCDRELVTSFTGPVTHLSESTLSDHLDRLEVA